MDTSRHRAASATDIDTNTDLASRFIDALGILEHDRRLDPLVGLFTEDAELVRQDRAPEHGSTGARQFWTDYRDMFDHIESTFTHISSTTEVVVLEWIGTGSLPTGRPIRYPGASVLEVADDRITGFRTYYDSAAFLTGASGGDAVEEPH